MLMANKRIASSRTRSVNPLQTRAPASKGAKSGHLPPSRRLLAASEKLWRTFVELSSDGILIGARAGAVDYANPAACKMFGYTAAELKKRGGYVTIDVHDPRYRAWIEERRCNGRAIGEITCIRRSGERFEAEISSSILSTKSGQVESIVIIRDISERKNSEREKNQFVSQLRELARQQRRSREEERTSVARYIHDEVGHSLTSLKIELSLLEQQLPPKQSKLSAQIQSMQAALDETTKNVRRLATELRPGLLDELGLVAAIDWQLQQILERSKLDYEFKVNKDDIETDKDSATALFRILQEALNNIILHSEASRVFVNLHEDPDNWTMTIGDNGKGIPASQVTAAQAIGLLGMRERASAVGGTLNIEGKAGEGTRVVVQIPRSATDRRSDDSDFDRG
jgi:PAS domain S-box-containing protein